MAKKMFCFEKTVYLADVDLFGSTYFARYFDWQGMAREEFFKQAIGDINNFLKLKIRIVTIEAYIKYLSGIKVFDKIIIKVYPDNIKVTTFDLIFSYFNKKTKRIVATGKQRIGFVNEKGAIVPIPKKLKENWLKLNYSNKLR